MLSANFPQGFIFDENKIQQEFPGEVSRSSESYRENRIDMPGLQAMLDIVILVLNAGDDEEFLRRT